MSRQLSVLLIEDDSTACVEIQHCITTTDSLYLAGITDNAEEALKLVSSTLPDVIILDLELHQGGGNGLLFLQELRQLSLPLHPYILITTNNTSEVTFDLARQLGADFILAKYETGYSAQYVIDFILTLKDTLLSRHNASEISPQPLAQQQVEKQLIQRIRRELNLVGINPKLVGFPYLIDAILLTAHNSKDKLTQTIALKYKKNDSSVERAMQNAIKQAWRTNDIDELLKYYTARIRADRGVPTLMEFICYYADKIKDEIN